MIFEVRLRICEVRCSEVRGSMFDNPGPIVDVRGAIYRGASMCNFRSWSYDVRGSRMDVRCSRPECGFYRVSMLDVRGAVLDVRSSIFAVRGTIVERGGIHTHMSPFLLKRHSAFFGSTRQSVVDRKHPSVVRRSSINSACQHRIP